MKKISKTLLSVLSITLLTLSITAPSFATPTNVVDLTLTSLPASTSASNTEGETVSSTDSAMMEDWSTSGTTDQSMFWSLSIPDNIASAQCIDGSGTPKIIKAGGSVTVTASNPDSTTDNNGAYVSFLNFTGPYAFSPGGGGGAPQDTEVGTSGGFASLATPFDLSSFNSAGFMAGMNHYTNGDITYSVTTKVPQLDITLSCQIEDGSSASGSENPAPTGKGGASAKSPKTGAGEVLLGTFLVALIASSFVVYKAIEKHRSTAQLSEK